MCKLQKEVPSVTGANLMTAGGSKPAAAGGEKKSLRKPPPMKSGNNVCRCTHMVVYVQISSPGAFITDNVCRCTHMVVYVQISSPGAFITDNYSPTSCKHSYNTFDNVHFDYFFVIYTPPFPFFRLVFDHQHRSNKAHPVPGQNRQRLPRATLICWSI